MPWRSDQKCSLKKGVLENFAKFTKKHLCQNLLFNKSFLLKKRLCLSCFPVNFVKFSRTPFLQNTFGRLLLKAYGNIDMEIVNYLELFQCFKKCIFSRQQFSISKIFSVLAKINRALIYLFIDSLPLPFLIYTEVTITRFTTLGSAIPDAVTWKFSKKGFYSENFKTILETCSRWSLFPANLHTEDSYTSAFCLPFRPLRFLGDCWWDMRVGRAYSLGRGYLGRGDPEFGGNHTERESFASLLLAFKIFSNFLSAR